MMIDLHSHSTASDGTLSPTDLVDLASERGLKALCLTDHDTVDGLPEATERAAQKGLRMLCGIEIEISWDNPGIFHLLGLNIGNYSHGMRELLPELQSLRAIRNEGILANMRADGIKVELEDIARFAGGRIITRPHFADFLIDIGKVRDRKSAFENYLAPGKPYYSRYPGITLDRACAAIHASGGLAMVAHPLSLYLSHSMYGLKASISSH